MNVCVAGLWHLGTVTAACLASAGHEVTGLDAEPTVVDALLAGKPPRVRAGHSQISSRPVSPAATSASRPTSRQP